MDVTAEYHRGAAKALDIAQRAGCRVALMKERSPSCGSGEIYDGSFTGARIPGDGVTAALLKRTASSFMERAPQSGCFQT